MIGDTCKIRGCRNILKKADGRICRSHNMRWYRHKTYNISPNWTVLKKGQPCLTPLGYLRINIDGKRILHHRYVIEQFLKRKLTKSERVHHINGIKTDNRIENLELFKNHAKHISKYHHKKILINWDRYTIPKHGTKGKCLIDNCDSKAKKRCLCMKHYLSYNRNFMQ